MKNSQKFGLITKGAVFYEAWKEIKNTQDKDEQEDQSEYFYGKPDNFPSYNNHKGNDQEDPYRQIRDHVLSFSLPHALL